MDFSWWFLPFVLLVLLLVLLVLLVVISFVCSLALDSIKDWVKNLTLVHGNVCSAMQFFLVSGEGVGARTIQKLGICSM